MWKTQFMSYLRPFRGLCIQSRFYRSPARSLVIQNSATNFVCSNQPRWSYSTYYCLLSYNITSATLWWAPETVSFFGINLTSSFCANANIWRPWTGYHLCLLGWAGLAWAGLVDASSDNRYMCNLCMFVCCPFCCLLFPLMQWREQQLVRKGQN